MLRKLLESSREFSRYAYLLFKKCLCFSTSPCQLNGTSASSSPSGGRDIHFVHAYILYQLLSRRIQRDLLLKSMLIASESGDKLNPEEGKKKTVKQEPVDYRLYPAVVKLLDAVLQSLMQMRTLTIVEDCPDLVSAVEARITFTNAQRWVKPMLDIRPFQPNFKLIDVLILPHATQRSKNMLKVWSFSSMRQSISEKRSPPSHYQNRTS